MTKKQEFLSKRVFYLRWVKIKYFFKSEHCGSTKFISTKEVGEQHIIFMKCLLCVTKASKQQLSIYDLKLDPTELVDWRSLH